MGRFPVSGKCALANTLNDEQENTTKRQTGFSWSVNDRRTNLTTRKLTGSLIETGCSREGNQKVFKSPGTLVKRELTDIRIVVEIPVNVHANFAFFCFKLLSAMRITISMKLEK